MADIEKELDRYESIIDGSKRMLGRAEGELKTHLEHLKEQYGINKLGEGEKLIEKMEDDLERMRNNIQVRFDKLKKEFPSVQ